MKEPINDSTECRVIIRFPQVDAAMIIFYPRIFELLFRCFPDFPLARDPHGFRLEFFKPNRLGDKLRLIFDQSMATGGWSVVGRMDDVDHFAISSLAVDEVDLSPGAHQLPEIAFTTDKVRVGEWMSNHKGVMQLSRYFEYLNESVEEWFEARTNLAFHELHVGRQVGIPTVRFTTRCRELPAIGDTVSIWFRTRRLGNRAMTFTSWLVREGECLIETEQVVVFVRMLQRDFESITIPDDIRTAFMTYAES